MQIIARRTLKAFWETHPKAMAPLTLWYSRVSRAQWSGPADVKAMFGGVMDIRPIRTEADYDWALAEVARYFETQPEVGSPDGDRFDVLSDLIAAYEDRHHPMPDLDPIEVLEAHMAETGKAQSDLAAVLGSRSRASEVLNRKRALTVDMIHRLDREWGLPPELMVKPYRRAA